MKFRETLPEQITMISCFLNANNNKTPCYPNGHNMTAWNNSANWLTYAAAVNNARRNPDIWVSAATDGLRQNKIIVTDIDHCRQDLDNFEGSGEPSGMFGDFAALSSYTERSRSGDGAHIFLRLTEALTEDEYNSLYHEKGYLETKCKHIVLTGNVVEGLESLATVPKELYMKIVRKWERIRLQELTAEASTDNDRTLDAPMQERAPAAPASTLRTGDREIPDLDRIQAQGEDYVRRTQTPSTKAGKEMYNCPVCGSGTGKNGTGALHIKFTGGGRIEWYAHCKCEDKGIKGGNYIQFRYFLQTGRQLDDKKSQQYLEYAKELSREHGIPTIIQTPLDRAKADYAAPLPDMSGFEREIIVKEPTPEPRQELTPLQPMTFYLPAISKYLSDKELRKPFKTGFEELDNALGGGLYPEQITVIGALPSLGKSTYALQIADNVASDGKPVLYFALEMSKAELFAKSISRIMYQRDPQTALSQLEVMNYFNSPEKVGEACYDNMMKSSELYTKTIADNLYIVEGRGDISINDIEQTAHQLSKQRNERPLIILDYFQLMRAYLPETNAPQEYEALKYAIQRLKVLAQELRTHIIVISSLNRQNYSNSANMSGFKGTGELEFCADNMLGLQLSGTGSANFNFDEEKHKKPRSMELINLKGRTIGEDAEKFLFRYYSKFNYFVGVTAFDEFREALSKAPKPKVNKDEFKAQWNLIEVQQRDNNFADEWKLDEERKLLETLNRDSDLYLQYRRKYDANLKKAERAAAKQTKLDEE